MCVITPAEDVSSYDAAKQNVVLSRKKEGLLVELFSSTTATQEDISSYETSVAILAQAILAQAIVQSAWPCIAR